MAMIAAEEGPLLGRHLGILPGYVASGQNLIKVAVGSLIMRNHKCEDEGVRKCWSATVRISQAHRISSRRDQAWWIILNGRRAAHFGYYRVDQCPVEAEFD